MKQLLTLLYILTFQVVFGQTDTASINYNYIQKFFPKSCNTTLKFLSVFQDETMKSDSVIIQEKITRYENEIYYELVIHNSILVISLNTDQVSVIADSNYRFNSLYKQKYSRKINEIKKIPKNCNVEGWYKEFNEDNSIRLSISWPHPYYLYFTFDKNELIVHKFTTNKIDISDTYYFSVTQGLYKIIQEIGPFTNIMTKINNAP